MSEESEWDRALIPVFASVPSKLDAAQKVSRRYIYSELKGVGLQPRTVGGSDPGMYNPLHEVRTLARHCAGGIILGYSQITADSARTRVRKETDDGQEGFEEQLITLYKAPTPWNQLETGILFGLGLPLFVLKQDNISGGIFDEGASDVLVHSMPMPLRGTQCQAPEATVNPYAQEGFTGSSQSRV